jgi:hypothetical protein
MEWEWMEWMHRWTVLHAIDRVPRLVLEGLSSSSVVVDRLTERNGRTDGKAHGGARHGDGDGGGTERMEWEWKWME